MNWTLILEGLLAVEFGILFLSTFVALTGVLDDYSIKDHIKVTLVVFGIVHLVIGVVACTMVGISLLQRGFGTGK